MAFKGEKVKGWKGEKIAFKGEKVKGWKGEKMASPTTLVHYQSEIKA